MLDDSINHISSAKSLPEAFFEIADRSPDRIVYSQAVAKEGDVSENRPRSWKASDYSSVKARVCRAAAALRQLGVTAESKVAVLSNTRPEWLEADLAILSASAVSVSVYQSLPPDDIAFILYDSGAEAVFAENQEQVNKLLDIISREISMPGTEDREPSKTRLSLKAIISFEEVDSHPLVQSWKSIVSQGPAEVPKNLESISADRLATLVYTSGTTGPPKGVMQTHGNHLANVRQAFASSLVNSSSSICLFLPLAHSFAKLMGYIGFITPVTLYFPAVSDIRSSRIDPRSTSKDIRECGAEIFPVVPRLLEKMRDGVLAAAGKRNVQGLLTSLTIRSADSVYRAKEADQRPSLWMDIAFRGTSRVRTAVKRKLFGPCYRFCVSGGAKLPVDVAEFFTSLGMDVLEGYGLTETCVATNVARLGETPLGSVGPVLSDDIEMKITEEGEICFRGPNVTRGYYNRPTATKEAWDNDGWFHTGDLGEVDDEGNLKIIGRKKDIIVTSGGKNIAPADIEEKIKQSSLVSQAVMLGDSRKYCIALISLNLEAANSKAARAGSSEGIPPHKDKSVYDLVWDHVQKVNSELASFETIKKIHIVPEEFSVENGLLTPTLKVKRSAVEKAYSAEIEALY